MYDAVLGQNEEGPDFAALWVFGGGRAIPGAVVGGVPGQGAQPRLQLLVLGSLLSKDGLGQVGDLHSILNPKHHPVDTGNLRECQEDFWWAWL